MKSVRVYWNTYITLLMKSLCSSGMCVGPLEEDGEMKDGVPIPLACWFLLSSVCSLSWASSSWFKYGIPMGEGKQKTRDNNRQQTSIKFISVGPKRRKIQLTLNNYSKVLANIKTKKSLLTICLKLPYISEQWCMYALPETVTLYVPILNEYFQNTNNPEWLVINRITDF